VKIWFNRVGRVLRRRERPPKGREQGNDWRLTFKRRVLVVTAVLGVWVFFIQLRLAYVQIIQHADYNARAEQQHNRTRDVPAKRGDIVDRKGHLLATSVDADTVYAVPSEIGDADVAVAKLCTAFRDCTSKERQSLTERLRRRGAFAYVRRQVSPDEKRRVEELNLEGIGFVKESRRFYPNRELGAHVLGYVGIDNVGLGGLEAAYDSQIRGKSGRVLVQTDARRQAFSRFERPPTSGSTVELTIDEYLQHVAERELHVGVVGNHAAGGTAIILDPHTGEILAMANEPTFNPNAYRDFEEVNRRNRAVQDLYEPGSTFKVVTASAAIEERVLPITTLIDTAPGQIRFTASDVVREDAGRNYGVLSFADVIVKSSNIGAIKIGFRVGTERLSRYVGRFGFGRPTSPDFPGESPGIVWDAAKWTERALASVSMGYQIGVTALQMVSAVGSVAHAGELVEPRLIRAIYRDNRRYAVAPRVLRRPVSTETAATLTGIMEQVVERGTAKAAKIPGYTIAGKTGTAAKLSAGHYSKSDYNASFVGFVPSRNPAVAIIVVVDSPHGPAGYHGGAVSAPIFKRIAESTLQYLGVPRSIDPEPPVFIARNDSQTLATLPQTSTPVVTLISEAPTAPGTLPDLRGFSGREALLKLSQLGLDVSLSGDGVVISQDPAPGTPLDAVHVCRLVLDRFPARVFSSAFRQ
jgi:cell division protein FtsI (penicillin-binding protein 3)